jgi:hypothetical protein
VHRYSSSYGRWLWHLAVSDPEALGEQPCARITPERVRPYVEQLRLCNAPLTVVDRMRGLKRMTGAFDPGGDWRWLGRLVNRVAARACPVRDKRSRMRPPDEVFQAALRLLATAETGSGFTSATKQALAFRDGLLLAILACRAPRGDNLAMMEIGRHLQFVGGAWTIGFTEGEMKNHVPWAVSLPEELTQPIQRYLEHWRPILLDGRCTDRVWLSLHRRPLDGKAIHYVVTLRMRRLFGVAMYPHLFRSSMMTETAIRDPKHVGIAAPILGHQASGTGNRHYNLARQHEAVRHFQQLTLKLRRSARFRRSSSHRKPLDRGSDYAHPT